MTSFPTHTIESAPEASRPLLRGLREAVGMIPNLAAAMAESPALLASFLAVRQHYTGGSFTPAEIQVLSLVAAVENRCAWCVAFHATMGLKDGVSATDVAALRAGREPEGSKLAALAGFARAMVRGRGAVPESVRAAFFAVGYSRAQALEVVAGMAFSLMANYAGHLVDAPLDAPLAAQAWPRPGEI